MNASTPSDFYAADLAKVHHDDFGDIAEAAATTILAETANAFDGPVVILDLGCGSGTTAARLVTAGHQVTGVDYAPAMVALARKNAPGATFIQASLFDYQLPKVEVITAISEAVNYLIDEKSSLATLRQLFQRIHAALKPGGLFIFDVLTTDVADYAQPRKAIVENDRWSMFLYVHVETTTDQLTREITLFTKEGAHYRRSFEVHRQQLYTLPDIAQELEAAGFTFQQSRHYSGLELRQGLVSFICQKTS